MILVTGGAGLLGSEVISNLISKGKAVKAIYNKTPLPDFDSDLIQKIQCSILDIPALEDVMQDVEQVYHCAGMVSFAHGSSASLYKINVEGTANVVNTALEAGVKKLLHVSSVATLGRSE